jgi:hypothetical protein
LFAPQAYSVTLFEDESLDIQEEDGHNSFSFETACGSVLETAEEEGSISGRGTIL